MVEGVQYTFSAVSEWASTCMRPRGPWRAAAALKKNNSTTWELLTTWKIQNSLNWLIPMNWFSLLPEYGVGNQMVSTKADRYTIIAGKKKVIMVDLCSAISWVYFLWLTSPKDLLILAGHLVSHGGQVVQVRSYVPNVGNLCGFSLSLSRFKKCCFVKIAVMH